MHNHGSSRAICPGRYLAYPGRASRLQGGDHRAGLRQQTLTIADGKTLTGAHDDHLPEQDAITVDFGGGLTIRGGQGADRVHTR